MKKSIVLIGMAGVGKSTIGRALARLLDYVFIDLDEEIIKVHKREIQELIDSLGEEGFMDIEKEMMINLDFNKKVIAPGGSIVYHPELMEYLKKNSILVYLKDDFENIAKRNIDFNKRGIVGLKSKTLKQVFEERQPLYSKYADVIVEVQGKTPQDIAKEITEKTKKFKYN